MSRYYEGKYTEHCEFYMWEVGGGCLARDNGKVYCCGFNTGCDREDRPTLDHCADCLYMTEGAYLPDPGKECHEKRHDCAAYRSTLMFSCGEGGE